jgi:hypothetical protein
MQFISPEDGNGNGSRVVVHACLPQHVLQLSEISFEIMFLDGQKRFAADLSYFAFAWWIAISQRED